MRKLLAVIGLLIWAALPANAQVGSGNQVVCNAAWFYDTAVSGFTTITVASPTGGIDICGFIISSGGNQVNVKISYGTAAAAASTTQITPAFQFLTSTTANETVADTSSVWRGLYVPAGNNLYLNTSNAASLQAIVYYYQQNTR